MARPIQDIESFKSKVLVDAITNCWNWQGYVEPNGYGHVSYKDKTIRAHRLSYILFKGNVNDGLVIAHSCNNRKCCNPDHLREDTRKSNSIDMVNSGNQRQQILSVDEVIEIKKSLKHYYKGQINDLAHFYKVNHRTISSIKNGKSWSHISIT
jgi:hypothetical protein